MKVLVAYMTKTGNTRKVAEAIVEEIREEKEIKKIEDVESLEDYDLSFLGFPIHQMGPDKKTAKLIRKHCINGRKIALFITHAGPEDSPNIPPMLEKFKQEARGADLVGFFDCQGELAKGVKRIMYIMPDKKLRMWAKMDNSQGQPDASRIDKARAFARDVMNNFQQSK